eukprot:scaffold203_cov386-Prasinococcus_capsulatus_cf.AAC.12
MQRLGAAERSVQTLRDQRDDLKDELEDLKQDEGSAAKALAQKDEMLRQYAKEGEGLSKKVLDLEKIVKKLRGKERELETERERHLFKLRDAQARLDEKEREASSWKELCQHKDDQSSQALHSLQKELHDSRQEAATLLETVRGDRDSQGALGKGELAEALACFKREAEEREVLLTQRIEALQASLSKSLGDAASKEDALRKEIRRLELECQHKDEAMEEARLCQHDATGMHSTLRHLEATRLDLESEKEKCARLQEERAELERQLSAAAVLTENSRQKAISLSEQLQLAETAAGKLQHAAEQAKRDAMQAQQEAREAVKELGTAKKSAASALQMADARGEEASRNSAAAAAALEQLEVSKVRNGMLESEVAQLKGNAGNLAEALQQCEKKLQVYVEAASRGDPGPKEGEKAESKGLDDLFAALPEGYDAETRAQSKTLESDESELKALQEQLNDAIRAREDALTAAVDSERRAEEARKENKLAPGLRLKAQELQAKLDTALVMVGERNERIEELEFDMRELKGMYKEHMNILMPPSRADPAEPGVSLPASDASAVASSLESSPSRQGVGPLNALSTFLAKLN